MRPGQLGDPMRELREAIIHLDGSEQNVKNLSLDIAPDIQQIGDDVTRFTLECVSELPVKTPVYALLIALIKSNSEEFGLEFSEKFLSRVGEALEHDLMRLDEDKDARTRVKLLVRFIVCASVTNLVSQASAVDVLTRFAEKCVAMSKTKACKNQLNPKAWQPRADFLATVVLSALPWSNGSFAKGTDEVVQGMYKEFARTMEEYMGARDPTFDKCARVLLAKTDSSKEEEENKNNGHEPDALEELWGRVNEADKRGLKGWAVAGIVGVQEPFEQELFSFSTVEAPKITIPDYEEYLNSDSAATALTKFPSRPRLRVINRAQTEGGWEKNDWQPLERFVAEEHVVDTLWAFEPGFRRAALHPATEQLATLPLPADHPERCQYLVAETCFGELLNLPRPRFEPVFYHVVIQDLCKAIPSFPPKMAKTVGELFRAMDRLDEELRERLATWMAHHLSCFDLVWPWKSWVHVSEQPDGSPQREFVRTLLRKLCDLSYPKNVKESIPEAIYDLLPKEAKTINQAYVDSVNAQTNNAIDTIREMLKAKTPSDELEQWLKESSGGLTAEQCLACVATAILVHGQKCITHLDTLMTRYDILLRKLIDHSSTKAKELLEAIVNVWEGSQNAKIAVDRTICAKLCDIAFVAEWAGMKYAENPVLYSDTCGYVLEHATAEEEHALERTRRILHRVHDAEREAEAAGQAAERFLADGLMHEATRAQTAEAAAVELAASLDAGASEMKQFVTVAREKASEITVLCARSCVLKAMELSDQTGADARLNKRIERLLRGFREQLAGKESEVLDACGGKGANPLAFACERALLVSTSSKFSFTVEAAHKKGTGSVKNGRDSNPKYRGVKLYGQEKCRAGNIIVRQLGNKFHAGPGVGTGKDFTLFALRDGEILFKKGAGKKQFVCVVDAVERAAATSRKTKRRELYTPRASAAVESR
ncbi:unnamed protein product [Bathycoccus prasinos]